MRVALLDQRTLVVSLVNPAGLFFNWSTNAWELPFDPTKHVRPMTGLPSASDPDGVFAGLQSAGVGTEILSNPDVIAVVLAVSSVTSTTGVTTLNYKPIQVWTLPAMPASVIGGLMGK